MKKAYLKNYVLPVLASAFVFTSVSAQQIIDLGSDKKQVNASATTKLTPVQLSISDGGQEVEVTSVDTYLTSLVAKGQLDATDAQYVVTAEHTSRTSGIHHIYFRQAINGIAVYGTDSSIHLAQGNLIKSNNGFVKNINGTLVNTTASLTAKQAVAKVSQQMNYSLTGLEVLERSNSLTKKTTLNKAGISATDIPAELMYYYKDGQTNLVWELSVEELTSSDWWNFRVHAATGRIIDKDNWTVSCLTEGTGHNHNHATENAATCEESTVANPAPIYTVANETTALAGSYNVLAMPVESPNHGSRSIVTNPDNAIASPFGWHDTDGVAGAESQYTIGNNVDAYDDRTSTVSGTGSGTNAERAFGGPTLTFNDTFNTNVTLNGGSIDAAVTNIFYWSNIIHDVTYQYGFDAASGNFQQNQYGETQGVGNDSVRAEAQDGSGTCNANFSTPTDGGRGRMQMYVCNTRDGDFDNGVVVHEYGHGISTRLTGGAGSSCLSNTEQMGEGWSDYFGLMFTMNPGDTGATGRGVGTWLVGQAANGPGIRTHRYSTSFGINPHTYDDINTEVAPHGVGSVWAMMIWEMTWEIMDKYEAASGNGFNSDLYAFTGNASTDAGNIQAMAIVMEGLKLQGCSPGFIDGRDAILLADQNIYGGANQCEIWAAFARRGLGFSADQGSSASKTDGTEAFDLPPGTATFNNSISDLCITEGTQTNLGGGLPTGGTYSGPGVTDNGDGSTYDFDPVAAGVGVHNVTYNVIDSCTGGPVNIVDTITVSDGNPLLVCEDYTVTLDASGNATIDWPDVVANEIQNDYIVATGGTVLETLTGAATNLTLGDDAVTGALPIGFSFDFYGETVSNFYVASNGYIYFTPNAGMTGAQSRTAQAFPDATIPNGVAALFMTDLDPSAGGTIRYELLGTAPNRKLVVEFSNVPQWNSPANTNSGQIQIYEGTNVVEMHVSEVIDGVGVAKTLGVESISGTNATTHPSTNNAAWSVTSPGLVIRFTPQAPSFADNCGNSVSFTLSESAFTCLDVGEREITVTADDGNGGVSMCTTTVTIEPNPAQLTTYNGSWDNGAPTTTSVASFAGNYDTSAGNIETCSCIVEDGATVTVAAGDYLRAQGNINVNGTGSLIVEPTGSVVQVESDAVVNKSAGATINVNVVSPVLQTRDFMVMGSPMDSETRNGVFTNAFLVLDHTPNNFNPHTSPNIPQDATNFKDQEGDFWQSYTGSINVGEGYIVRPQSGYTDPANTTYPMTFAQGTLNNGNVTRTVIYNGTNSPLGTPNAFANPYASGISADAFITANGLNALYFWEHLTPPSVIVPGESIMFDMGDVSIRNLGGGNAANNGGAVPGNIISTGQGFAIKATANGSVTFTNSMRVTTGNTTLRLPEENVDRLWLRVASDAYETGNNMLIGFNPNATAGWDEGYDTDRLASMVSLYSQFATGDERMAIQTREAFKSDIQVPIGFSTLVDDETSYTISLSDVEGANLVDAKIYLLDTELNVLTDLTAEDYSFTTGIISQDRRFTLLFETEVLGVADQNLTSVVAYPNPTNGMLNIVSPTASIETIAVLDVMGRTVQTIYADGVNHYELNMSSLNSAMYFVEITTANGSVTKRILKE